MPSLYRKVRPGARYFASLDLLKKSKEINKKYKDINSIKLDTIIAVSIGGVISICIIVTSASLQGANITNPSEIRGLLEPLYGNISNWII